MRILGKLLEFFLESEPAGAVPAVASVAAESPAADDGEALRQVKQSIQRELAGLAAENAASVEGRVHLLDIGKLAALAAGHRKTFRIAARKVIEQTMARHLGAADHYAMLSDFSVLLVFHNTSETQAQLRCATVAQEILHRLLGDKSDLDLISVHSARRGEADELTLMELPASAMIEMLVEQAEVHEIDLPGEPMADESAPAGPDPLDPLPRSPGAALEGWQPIDRTGEAAEQWRRLETGGGGVTVDRAALQALEAGLSGAIRNVLAGLDDLEAELAEMREQEAAAAAPADRQEERPAVVGAGPVDPAGPDIARKEEALADLDLQIWFTPFLNVNSWLLGTYGIRIGVQIPGQPHAVPLSACTLGEETKAQIDRLALRRAVCELIDSEAFAKQNLIGVQVHYSTLMRMDDRRELLRYCGLLPEKIRRRLIWEIVDAPRNSWTNGLLLGAAALRPFGRAILLQSDLAMSSVGDLGGARFHAVGVDLTTLAMDEAMLFPQLERFVEKAKQRGLKSYLAGCNSRSVALAAIGAGFDYVSGTSISGWSMTSIAARRYAPGELFQTGKAAG